MSDGIVQVAVAAATSATRGVDALLMHVSVVVAAAHKRLFASWMNDDRSAVDELQFISAWLLPGWRWSELGLRGAAPKAAAVAAALARFMRAFADAA